MESYFFLVVKIFSFLERRSTKENLFFPMTTGRISELFVPFFLKRPKLVATACLIPSLGYVARSELRFREYDEEKKHLNDLLFGGDESEDYETDDYQGKGVTPRLEEEEPIMKLLTIKFNIVNLNERLERLEKQQGIKKNV